MGWARRFAVAQLNHWGLRALSDTVTLIASELATNSVRATGTKLDDLDLVTGAATVAMRLRLTPVDVCVEVWDRDPSPPVLGDAGVLDEGGRGLTLVAALTKAWGHYLCVGTTGGKVVWAEVAAPR